MSPKAFGELIKTEMNDLGMDETTFAEEIGVTQATVNRLINGKVTPTLDTLIGISKALKFDIGALIAVLRPDAFRAHDAPDPIIQRFKHTSEDKRKAVFTLLGVTIPDESKDN